MGKRSTVLVALWLSLPAAGFAQSPPVTLPPPAPNPAPIGPPVLELPPAPVGPPTGPPPQPLPSPFGAGLGLRGPAAAFNPVVGQVPFLADYRLTDYLSRPVYNQPAQLGYFQQDVVLRAPVWQGPSEEWFLTSNLRTEWFHTNAILPTTFERFPDQLWSVNLGSGYRHEFDNGWIGGANVSVGSASDKPFHSIHEMSVMASGTLRVPSGEYNAWLFSLSLSSNSQVLNNIPIPGVAYLYAPSRQFQAIVGLPAASIFYRPTDDLTLTFAYALLTTFNARATYRVAKPVAVYVAFDNGNENYFRADRPDTRDRFFYYDTRLSAGGQMFLSKQASLDLSGGYVFDRYYFEGRSLSDSHQNRVDVGSGAFLAIKALVKY